MKEEGSTSFYSSEEEFTRYLRMTSFYTDLQKNLLTLVPSDTRLVVDFGTGTGSTAVQIAKKCNKGTIYATDIRPEIIKVAAEIAEREKVQNMHFDIVDINKLGSCLKKKNLKPDLITALYAFHHIGDPTENKKKVVQEMFESLEEGGKVIIADPYTELEYTHTSYKEKVREQYRKRANEAYNSVFWAVLREKIASKEDVQKAIAYAKEVAEYSKKSEVNAMNGVLERTKAKVPECLITEKEMKQLFQDAGFKIKLFQKINNIGEAILLAEK